MQQVANEKEVFTEALALDADERERYLRLTCPDDSFRLRIDALLRHHTAAGDGIFLRSADRSLDADETRLSASMPAHVSASMPAFIDEFRILRRIGEGGMGSVYLAEDTLLGRKVALKVLAPHLIDSEEGLSRFRQEARAAANVTHPSIVPVYRLGIEKGIETGIENGRERSVGADRHYIVSEFVDGPTLTKVFDDERIRRREAAGAGVTGGAGEGALGGARTVGILAWHRRVAECIATIAEGLEACHRAGIVHRDVKPSNILLDRERGPRLTDFGIAKRLPASGRGFEPTSIIGSCHYMSPEQASTASVSIDQRSDVFSLGVVLYEALSLRRPFEGRDVHEVLRAVVGSDPPRLRTLDRLLAKDLETICHKALEKDPPARYQTAAHMAADLRCWLSGRPILAQPPGFIRRSRRWIVVHRREVALGVGAGLVALTGGLAWIISVNRDANSAWIRVSAPIEGCTVLLERSDARTLELPSAPESLGVTPLEPIRLAPGQYRVTLVTPTNDAFVEWNAILLDIGLEHAVTLRAVTPDADLHPFSGTSDLVAVLRPTDEARSDGMFGIDAGKYPFGVSDDPAMRTHRRTLELRGFHIDRREVSNREYGLFLAATGRPAPATWRDGAFDPALVDRPVVGVSIEDAEAYARWKGKRLPTMFEWEAAARGPDGRRYPWVGGAVGEGIGAAPANLAEFESSAAELRSAQSRDVDVLRAQYATSTRDVASPDPLAPDASMQHALDNVRELTATVVLPSREGVIKGRSWVDTIESNDLTAEWTHPIGSVSVNDGFRCAKSNGPPKTVPAPSAPRPPPTEKKE